MIGVLVFVVLVRALVILVFVLVFLVFSVVLMGWGVVVKGVLGPVAPLHCVLGALVEENYVCGGCLLT